VPSARARLTIASYGTSVAQLAAFLAAAGMPTSPTSIAREHVGAFMTDLLARWKPATAHNRYRALRSSRRMSRRAARGRDRLGDIGPGKKLVYKIPYQLVVVVGVTGQIRYADQPQSS
jgi:hypothetical protein